MMTNTTVSPETTMTNAPMIRLLIPACLLMVLGACGESDLADIRSDALAAAQQQGATINPVNSSNNGNTALAATDGTVDSDSNTDTPAETVRSDVDVLLESHSLVFSDEFNAATLDAGKWNTAFQWGPDVVIMDELQYYVDTQEEPDFGYDPFMMTGNELVITSVQTPPDLSADANGQPYLSGAMTSQGLFDFQRGYAEIRAKLPDGRGFWPGFWMLGTEFVDLKPQLYVMENRGDNGSLVYHRYNYTNADGEFIASDLYRTPGEDFINEFHTYGVQWTEDAITWYVDGNAVQTLVDTQIPAQDMYLILNQTVGGWLPEAPDETTEFPGEYVIDYVRVYQPVN